MGHRSNLFTTRARKLITAPESGCKEIWLGLLMLCLGAFLLLPHYIFGLIQYRIMAAMASEDGWGLLMVFIGIATLYGYFQGSIGYRKMIVFMVAMVLFVITTSITVAMGTTGSLAPVMYAFALLMAVWTYVKLGLEKNKNGGNGNG